MNEAHPGMHPVISDVLLLANSYNYLWLSIHVRYTPDKVSYLHLIRDPRQVGAVEWIIEALAKFHHSITITTINHYLFIFPQDRPADLKESKE